MSRYSTPNNIKLGNKTTGLKCECLAYADDVVFSAETLEIAIKQIEVLKKIAEKPGLQISFGKTEYMNVDAKHPTWTMRTRYGDIKRANKFMCFGEILTPNINENGAI